MKAFQKMKSNAFLMQANGEKQVQNKKLEVRI